MYEIDFLPVGDGERSGDAIAMRFTRPDTGSLAHVIIDAGFEDDGEALVAHVNNYYGTDQIDLAILTHPDGDHIGGMGVVVRKLRVAVLAVHRLGTHGGQILPAAEAVVELIELAESEGAVIQEPFTGTHGYGGALTVVGPDEDYYNELVSEQVAEHIAKAAAAPTPSRVRHLAQRFLARLPEEIPFGDRGGPGPRNNTSVITLLEVDGLRALFTADAGVPALERAWAWLESSGANTAPPEFIQIPHHGSRRNASSTMLTRLLEPTGQPQLRTAVVSVAAANPRNPSPRVVNAYMRRGYGVGSNAEQPICYRSADTPHRENWGPLKLLDPMDESEDH